MSESPPNLDRIECWDYELPDELIAREPAANRDLARLLRVPRSGDDVVAHQHVRDLPSLLKSGDLLVFNNTRVVPARLFGFRTSTGGRWEGLYLGAAEDGSWRITGQTRGRLTAGESLTIVPAVDAEQLTPEAALRLPKESTLVVRLIEKLDGGEWRVQPESAEHAAPALSVLERFGTLPLPPYIRRKVATEADAQRYQTIYAEAPGAIAAPTAGLHFTDELLRSCREAGINTTTVTLHVGIGTFRPVSSNTLSAHQMHSEWCRVPEDTVTAIRETQERGGRVIAVGTTSVRSLEAAAAAGEGAWEGHTSLFIRPGYTFQLVDGLLTNFHLPRSTLLALVAAFAGYENMMQAYEEAVKQKYRFYSYGDAMLIL